MVSHTPDSNLVNFSVIVYGRLLVFYPRRFRDEFGAHMLQVFRDCLREACRRGGLAAVLVLWGKTLFDYLKTLLEEHLEGLTDMNRTKFIRLSGWALVIGALGWLLTFGARSLIPENYYPNPYNVLNRPIYGYVETAALVLSTPSFILMCIGIGGLYLRVSRQVNGFARLMLVLTILSGLVCGVSLFLLLRNDSEPFWSSWLFSLLAFYLSMAVFGGEALRLRLPGRFSLLALLAGALPVLLFVTGLGIETVTGNMNITPLMFGSVLIFSGLCLAGLGLALRSDPITPETGQLQSGMA
jgi:hypothetical protein